MKPTPLLSLLVAAALATPHVARADAITDWNQTSADLITEARIGTPPAIRIMAVVQTAAREAVAAAQQRNASAEAAIAAAHRISFTRQLPALQAKIDASYQAALADGPAKTAGIAASEAAAQAVLAARADDVIGAEAYRPHTSAGAYVPTVPVAVPQWAQRKPWLLANVAQFRPAPPPALASSLWARDFNEAKEFGGRTSTRRSAEQTEAARFWDYSLPAIYHGVVRSVALAPNRDLAANARLVPVSTPGYRSEAHWRLDRRDGPAPYLSYSPECSLCWAMERALAAMGSLPPLDMSHGSSLADGLRSMATIDMGAAWLPDSLVREDIVMRKLMPCGEPEHAVPPRMLLLRKPMKLGARAESLWQRLLTEPAEPARPTGSAAPVVHLVRCAA